MRLADFDAVLFDIDGTLLLHHEPLPGAADALRIVSELSKPFAFVTNNSATSVDTQLTRLGGAGLPATRENLYTSGTAMADWIRQRWDRPRIFNFAGEAVQDELTHAQFVTTPDEQVDVVTVGSHHRENAVEFDLDAALVGLHHLRRGAELLIGSTDRVYMYDGMAEFGSGSWGALFAYGANLPASRVHYAGKPDPEFFTHLCERLNVSPKRTLLIGDNLEADIEGGLRVGMTTALLLTGVTTRTHAEESTIKAHMTFSDLPALLDALS